MSFLAQVSYTGNGSTTQYSITFPYIDVTHVKAYLNGTLTSAYTISSSTLTFTTAPANGVVIRIERQTPSDNRLVDFTDGSVLTESDLDRSADQNFYIAQEITDDSSSKLGLDTDDKYDANNKVIKNLANPVNNNDAVNKTYLENTWLSPANKSALTTVNANIANINAVNSNASNINSAVANQANINTVATNIGSVNTVATDIAKVITVANDLAEAVSEVETVANDLNEATSEIDTVASSISNVDAVGTNIANVNTVAGISANVTTVAGNNANVTTVAGISGDVTTVAGISSNVTSVAGNNTNITTVAGINSDVTSVAGVSSNVSTLAPIASNITTVAGISANVTAVAGDATDIGTVAFNLTGTNTIGTVAGSIANVNNVGGSIANVNTVATNLSGVNYFGERYRVSATAPITSLDIGDLYYDTATDAMKVYGSSGWQNAGSSVNGTSQRYNYTATASQTTFTGADNGGNTLTYDAGYIDVYLNGVKLLNGTDVTVTSGSSVVLASGATTGDVVDIVAYGTFSVASLNADNLDSGTVPSARISGAYTGITQTGTLASFASTGIDDNSTSTAITIDSSNRVSIRNTSTTRDFHVGDSSGATTMEIESANNSSGTIFFGDNNSGASGRILYDHTDNFLRLDTNIAERMRIDSSGNLLIGKTSANTATEGVEFRSFGLGAFTRSGNQPIIANRTSNNGIILELQKDGTQVGVIGTLSSNLYVGSLDTGLYFNNSSDSIYAINTTTNAGRDNAIDLGVSTTRFKDIYLGGGLYVGGTGTANKLDDYEEGTWTPTYVASTTDFTSVTYQQQNGKYTKIGDTVSLTVTLSTNAITKGSASGEVYIAGLPFTPNSNYSNGTILYNTANWLGDIPDGWTTFGTTRGYLFYKSSTTAVSSINPADMGTGGSANNFIATMIYKTDA
jgi:hypothetical protein